MGKNINCAGNCVGWPIFLMNKVSLQGFLLSSTARKFCIDESLAKFILLVVQIIIPNNHLLI